MFDIEMFPTAEVVKRDKWDVFTEWNFEREIEAMMVKISECVGWGGFTIDGMEISVRTKDFLRDKGYKIIEDGNKLSIIWDDTREVYSYVPETRYCYDEDEYYC